MCICIPFLGFAQEVLHSRKKKAIADYQEARSLLLMGQNAEASVLLRSAIDRDKSFDEAIMLLMQVYLDRNDKTQAFNLYANSFEELQPSLQARMDYDLAKFLWLSGDYSMAKDYLERISTPIDRVNPKDFELLQASIAYALGESQKENELVFESLASKMNDFDMQYFPSIDASGQLVFTGRDKRWGGDEQIFVVRDSAKGWSTPKLISTMINSPKNEGTAAISADGRTLVFTGCNRKDNIGGCDLYVSYHDGNDWSAPDLLPETVNSRFWESQPSLNSNGQTLYFVSTRPGKGGQDIWVSRKKGDRWTEAEPLSVINTEKDDASPFIYPDDRTLFFASNGRVGLGRFDLFQTKKINGQWSIPENLGGGINDARDQMGYCIGLDGWAYFSTTEPSGRILMKRFRFPEKLLPKVVPQQMTVVLTDAKNGAYINGEVLVEYEEEKVIINRSDTGIYSTLLLNPPKAVRANAKGYYAKKLEEISDSVQIALTPYELGEPLIAPLYFETNSHELDDEQLNVLQEIMATLQEHIDIHLRIEGYTDRVGSAADNLRLSSMRAMSVLNFLKQRGIASDRLEVVVFGESEAGLTADGKEQNQQERKVILRLIPIKSDN